MLIARKLGNCNGAFAISSATQDDNNIIPWTQESMDFPSLDPIFIGDSVVYLQYQFS